MGEYLFDLKTGSTVKNTLKTEKRKTPLKRRASVHLLAKGNWEVDEKIETHISLIRDQQRDYSKDSFRNRQIRIL